MTTGSTVNTVIWNKVMVGAVNANATLILAANAKRIGAMFNLDCAVSDTCVLIKDENNTNDEGIILFREGLGVAVYSDARYEMTIFNVNRGAIYIWKHSGADVNVYATEYENA